MGTYVYTLRKKTKLLDGVRANYFSYAYKPSYSFSSQYNVNRSVQRYDAAADTAFESYEGGLVFVADPDDPDLDGSRVYRNVRGPIWNDSYDFPGEAVGFVKQVGRKLTVVPEHRWRAQSPNDRTFVEYVKDGKFASRVILDDPPYNVSLGLSSED